MNEVLSQEEIDRLLSQISSGEVDAQEIQSSTERPVKNYDFKRPAKFSKEHLRTLELIFEHYGRLLSTNLPVYLRKNITVNVASSETVTFSEFSNALSNPVILGIINFQPLNGNIVIELTANVGYAILDRMLGGQGEPLEKVRDFSEIELGILDKVLSTCTQLLREPWKNVVDVAPLLERIETNTQFAQIIAPNEMIAIVTLNVKLGDVEGFMNVCLPFMTLEPIVDNLNTKFWFTNMSTTDSEDQQEYLEALLRRVDVPVKAVLGKSQIAVGDFLGLQTGDIIRLRTKVSGELEIYVGNIRKFFAMPGTQNDHYAVRVTEVIREEE
ncbi:MAG: flagellar motor switch protein FliM [Lachnospiraceae bacterium]